MKVKRAILFLEILVLIVGFSVTIWYYNSYHSVDHRDTWIAFEEGEIFKLTIKNFELDYYVLQNSTEYQFNPCIILDDTYHRSFDIYPPINYRCLILAKGDKIKDYSLTFEVVKRISKDIIRIHIKEINENIELWVNNASCAGEAFCFPRLAIGFLFSSKVEPNNNFTLLQFHELFPTATVRDALKRRTEIASQYGNYENNWYQLDEDTFLASPKGYNMENIHLTNKTYHLISHKNKFDRIVINYYNVHAFTNRWKADDHYNSTIVNTMLSGPYRLHIEIIMEYS